MKVLKRSNKFFSEDEKKCIIESIVHAEDQTSGEIRVHLERRSRENPYEAAKKIFEKLGMTNTKERNGVLIYISVKDRKIAILGDKGINEKVPDGFWNNILEEIKSKFKERRYCEGVCKGIELTGEKLKVYFPHSKTDINELSDTISEG
ncbi:MAG: TPM domain-containing protein [bacterium]